MTKTSYKSPHDILPTKEPREEEFKDQPDFFYKNVVLPLIPTVIKMQANGIPIDTDRVDALRKVLDIELTRVRDLLANNSLIQEFLTIKYKKILDDKKEEYRSKMKTYDKFIKPYKPSDIQQRTEIVTLALKDAGIDNIHSDKYTIKDIKKINTIHDIEVLKAIVKKKDISNFTLVKDAITNIAKKKAAIYNKKYEDKISNIKLEDVVRPFNTNSATQKRELLNMLGVESTTKSKKTGEDSFDREALERILEEVNIMLEE